jgi:hypothetical protein
MWPNNGPPCQLVLTAEVRRSAEDSVADKGKYLRPTSPAALCMTSLTIIRFRFRPHVSPSIPLWQGAMLGSG